MGFDKNGTRLLSSLSARFGLKYDQTLTLGRQFLYLNHEELFDAFKENGIEKSQKKINDILLKNNGYAEEFLKTLGATSVDSIDANEYENASFIHDLNLPVPISMINKFDTVIDGGTLEHIFNFPQAIKNALLMLKVGGTYIGITPANNYFGHGFYQFSPELYYRIFTEENGFKLEKCLVYIDKKNAVFYSVSDPDLVTDRVILQNKYPTYLFIVAKKTSDKTIFGRSPQQSDYIALYKRVNKINVKNELNFKGKILAKLLAPIYFINYQLYKMKKKSNLSKHDLGLFNKEYFKEHIKH